MEDSGSPPIYCFVSFYRLNLTLVLAQFDKLYPWTLKNSTPEDQMEINYDKFETPLPVGQKENRVSEAQKSPENAPEVSRSCLNFPRPACFKVPLYTPISIQNNSLVLETLPLVVLGHFLSFLKEKRWKKYNQPFLSCHATLLPKGKAAHTRTTFLISLFETRWDNV